MWMRRRNVVPAAALAAFEPATLALLDARRDEFRARRDLLLPALRELGFDIPVTPQGAFYVFPNVSGLLNRPLANGTVCANDDDLCNYLLDQAHIAVVSGSSFCAPGYVRLSYATGEAQIEEGMRRFAAAVNG